MKSRIKLTNEPDTIMITIVAGFARCGSSMVMQMLNAGGYPVTGLYPGFEDKRALHTDCPSWSKLEGKAIKVLEPFFVGVPKGYQYKTIWLQRDYEEQAKSNIKFARIMLGLPASEADVPAYVKGYKHDQPICMKLLKQRGELLKVRFEDILMYPRAYAKTFSEFLQKDLDISKMAEAVLLRSFECQPELEIEKFLIYKSKGDKQ